jgi:transposase InsO family protein
VIHGSDNVTHPGLGKITVFPARRIITMCTTQPTATAVAVSRGRIVAVGTMESLQHGDQYRLFWAWKSRHHAGRPRVSAEVRSLIRTMANANPLWGAPRIHGELLKLGIDVSEATVAKYLPRRRRPPSPSWRTFLSSHVSQIAAADFFVVPTVTFRLLYVLIILSHERRRFVHVAVTAHPTAGWTAQQLREAFPNDEAPRFLVHDRDSTFAAVGTTVESIQDVRTAPRAPWQNPFAERVIGSIRRECLDHVIVLNERGLRRVLCAYVAYYHTGRTHMGLEKDTPISRPIASRGRIIAVPHVGGLHHRYDRGGIVSCLRATHPLFRTSRQLPVRRRCAR